MKNLSVTQYITLKLLASAVNGTAPKIDNDTLRQADWDTIGLFCSNQAVSLAVFDALTPIKECLPKKIYDKWMSHTLKALNHTSLIQQIQAELNAAAEGMPYTVIKGLSAASYYPKCETRNLGDVDFLINKKDAEQFNNNIKELGYTVYSQNDFHISYEKGEKTLEMHFEIPGIPTDKRGDTVRAYMENTVNDAKEITVMSQGFYVPQDRYHGVILLLHSVHHLTDEGLGLRHLTDWACFVNKTSDQAFWTQELLPLFDSIGYTKFVMTFTAACADYLEIPLPDWVQQIDKNLEDELMLDILSGGNFGFNAQEHQKSAALLEENQGVFKVMHKSMFTVYPVLKKAPYLYPFLFVHRVVKYGVDVIFGRKKRVGNITKAAKRRKKLYKDLQII